VSNIKEIYVMIVPIGETKCFQWQHILDLGKFKLQKLVTQGM